MPSQLIEDGLIEAVDIQQLETFKAATMFAQSEGIIPAPESSHAISAAIREALKAKEEGVKKITGISIASAGQLIVRGLGDRYSTTTLNGLPIASPNPDNKLVPLDLFPSSTVQNITVSKVYDAAAFADYSGAHINISTKETAADALVKFSWGTDANPAVLVGTDWKNDT